MYSYLFEQQNRLQSMAIVNQSDQKKIERVDRKERKEGRGEERKTKK